MKPNILYLNIWLTVKDAADVAQVRELLAEQGRLSRLEPGCLRFDVFQSQADEKRFLLCERWESQASLDAHRLATAYNTVYKPRVLPLVDREPHPSTLIGE